MRTIYIVVFSLISLVNTTIGQELRLVLLSSSQTFVVGEKIRCQLVIENFKMESIMKSTDFDFKWYKDFEYEFEIAAKKKGQLTLGPYDIDFNGKKLVSNNLVLTIVKQPTEENEIVLKCPEKATINQQIEIELVSFKTSLSDIKIKKDASSIVIGKISSSSSTSMRDGKTEYVYTRKIEITFLEKGTYKIDEDWFDNIPTGYKITGCKIEIE
jgi:hypothetical protein